MPGRRKVLLLDFDGTICRGDAPVRDYADRVAASLGSDAARRLKAALHAFLEHGNRDTIPEAKDGYGAVTRLAADAGIEPERVQDAFLAARQKLTDGELPIEVPDNLRSFLSDISVKTRIIVVTNAPMAGLETLLDRMAVRDLVDQALGDANKPHGMPAIVSRLLEGIDAGEQPSHLLSVGDIWENDLQVPSERGCATAYVDRFGLQSGRPTFTGPTIEDLYDSIRLWASEMWVDALR
jgi:FMN phosphatase YigB (HAD superfamily)